MNIYEMRRKIVQHEKAVFDINELSRILGVSKRAASVYVNRMIKKKLLFKIEKNKVAVCDDIFIVSSQILFPSYLSLTSALYMHNSFSQIINKIYILTTKKRKMAKIFGTEIIFVNINPKLLFGYRKVKKGESFINLADLEKAIIDCLYFPRYCRIGYLMHGLKKVNIKKFESYIRILNSEAVLRRAGYLLDYIKAEHSLKRRTNTIYKLNPRIRAQGKFNKKWYLYINEEVK